MLTMQGYSLRLQERWFIIQKGDGNRDTIDVFWEWMKKKEREKGRWWMHMHNVSGTLLLFKREKEGKKGIFYYLFGFPSQQAHIILCR